MIEEWNVPKKQYKSEKEQLASPAEYPALKREYKNPPEYAVLPKEYESVTSKGTKKTKERSKASTLWRKMSYLVAATASVVVISQTIEVTVPEGGVDIEMVKSEGEGGGGDSGIGVIPTPTIQPIATEEPLIIESPEMTEAPITTKTPAGMPEIAVTGNYESYGYGFGGVMPVKIDGLWGLVDFCGNVLVEPTYDGFWKAPNNEGYTIFNDENGYYVVGKEGLVREFGPEIENLHIGDENILTYMVWEETETGEDDVFVYETLNGEVIHKLYDAVDFWFAVMPLHNDRVYVYSWNGEDEEDEILLLLKADGTQEVVATSSEEWDLSNGGAGWWYVPPGPRDGYTDGYFVGAYMGIAGWALIDASDLSVQGYIEGINILPEEDWFSREVDTESCYFQSYYSDGINMYHYQHYGCIALRGENGQRKDVLFDWFNTDDSLTEYIAIYDTIVFDDFPYLLAQEGENWFYIDYEGNVVSKTYYDATSFNSEGYAIIMEEAGKGYVINSDFEKIEEIPNMISASLSGEVFMVYRPADEENGIEEGRYPYYYGTNYAE